MPANHDLTDDLNDDLPVDLGDLLERLRDAGFRVDTRQYLSAAELLIAGARRGVALAADPALLRDHLAPIFCTSPEEQALFAGVVKAWLGIEDPPPPPPPPAAPFATWRRARWMLPAALGLIAAIALAGFAIRKHWEDKKPDPPVIKTLAKVTPPATTPPATTPASAPAPEPLIRVAKIADIAPEAPKPVITSTRHTDWRRALLEALACVLGVFLLWSLVTLIRRRLVLQRLPAGERPELATLADDDAAAPLFDATTLRRATAALRRPRAQAVMELDVRSSIEAAARGGGFSGPVYAARRAVPEYLALIERRDAEDHQARLYDEMLGRLKPLGLTVDRYFFAGDPRTCFESGAPTRARLLGDVLAQQDRAAVLLFMEAGRCFNPVSGRLEPWVQQLGASARRALFTPVPPGQWTDDESKLAEEGFAVIAAGEKGLAAFGEAGDDRTADHLGPAPYARPYPRLLERQPGLALDREPPERAVTERLVRELRGYLGPRGFAWLAACAVYPEIDWPLTLHLARPIWSTTAGPPPAEDMRAQLAALARLPWFRLGVMPTWLRVTLISQLSHDQERAVRRCLAERLEDLARRTLGRRAGAPVPAGLRIGAWVGPLDLPRTSPPGTPMRDAVFLGYMAGARIPAPAVEAPSVMARLFRRVRRLPPEPRALRRAHRTARQRLVAWARALTVHRPALGGAALAVVAGALALGGLVPLNMHTTFTVPPTPKLSVAFTPDGKRVLTAFGGVLQYWDLDGHSQQKLAPGPVTISSVTISPDGKYIAATDDSPDTRLLDAATGRAVRTLNGRFGAFSPESQRLLTFLDGRAHLSWVATGEYIYGSTLSWTTRIGQFNVDGTRLILVTDEPRVSVMDTRSWLGWPSRGAIGNPANAPYPVALGPGGRYLVTRGKSPGAEIWEVSPDGSRNTQRGAVAVPPGQIVTTVAFGQDDLFLIGTGPAPYRIAVWDALSPDTTLEIGRGDRPFLASVSPDGRTIAFTDDRRASVWSLERVKKPDDKHEEPKVDADALMKKAQEAWQHHQCPTAIDLSRQALRARPEMTDAYQLIAACSCTLSDPKGAASAFAKLDQKSRKLLTSLCARNGIALGEVSLPCNQLPSIYFKAETSTVLAESMPILKHNADCIAAHPEWSTVRLVGNTDGRGTDEYNFALSERYASSVRDQLVAAGVPAARLSVMGRGSQYTVCSDRTPTCVSRNRRVEFERIVDTKTEPEQQPAPAAPPVAPDPSKSTNPPTESGTFPIGT